MRCWWACDILGSSWSSAIPAWTLYVSRVRNGSSDCAHPAPTYWNRDAPKENLAFMYWSYDKDNWAVSPLFDKHNTNLFELVRQRKSNPGLAFYAWERNTWFEFDGERREWVERLTVNYRVLDDHKKVRTLQLSSKRCVSSPQPKVGPRLSKRQKEKRETKCSILSESTPLACSRVLELDGPPVPIPAFRDA